MAIVLPCSDCGNPCGGPPSCEELGGTPLSVTVIVAFTLGYDGDWLVVPSCVDQEATALPPGYSAADYGVTWDASIGITAISGSDCAELCQTVELLLNEDDTFQIDVGTCVSGGGVPCFAGGSDLEDPPCTGGEATFELSVCFYPLAP